MKDKEFWNWVSEWLDVYFILDIVKNWDDEIIDDVYCEFVKRGLIKEEKNK